MAKAKPQFKDEVNTRKDEEEKLPEEDRATSSTEQPETQESFEDDEDPSEKDLSKVQRDKLVAQAIKEISFNRKYKQGKIRNWQKNEQMYYGVKMTAQESRANVELGRMQEYVHDILSKIDNPLLFKFVKRKVSQLKRVQRLNALRDADSSNDDWDIKDIVGKKQGVIYGRAVYSYFADSIDGYYKPHLSPLDVYDFLIDPAGGGLDMENALNMGDYGVSFTKDQLLQLLEDDDYDSDVIKEITNGTGNNTEMPQEEVNKRLRMYGQNTIGQKNNPVDSDNKFKFWRWCTTFYNEETKTTKRYYLLLQEKAGRAIRVCPLTEFSPATKHFPMGAWPYWSWAAFLDLTEFWTPSFCDYVRELFMAQSVSINQLLDNSEQVNKPQKLINVHALENLADLKYRRSDWIKTKNDVDVNKIMQVISTPAIDTPIKTFNLLEAIKQKASGVTGETNGTANTEGKVGIYEGNQENSADKFGLLNKSYSFGYKRFARLWEVGVRTHLIKKTAIDIIGPDGIETEMIKRSDLFKKGDEFNLMVEASNAETQLSKQEKSAKANFIQAQLTAQINPQAPKLINEKKGIEMLGKIVGFESDDMKELMDTSDYGDAELMSLVARDIEDLLNGEDVRPNPAATNAYRQKFMDWLVAHEENLEKEMFIKLTDYLRKLGPIVMQNESRAVQAHQVELDNQQANPPPPTPAPGGAQPTPPPIINDKGEINNG